MSAVAIVMMIVAMLIIWGGLAVATRFLVTHQSAYGDEGHADAGTSGTQP